MGFELNSVPPIPYFVETTYWDLPFAAGTNSSAFTSAFSHDPSTGKIWFRNARGVIAFDEHDPDTGHIITPFSAVLLAAANNRVLYRTGDTVRVANGTTGADMALVADHSFTTYKPSSFWSNGLDLYYYTTGSNFFGDSLNDPHRYITSTGVLERREYGVGVENGVEAVEWPGVDGRNTLFWDETVGGWGTTGTVLGAPPFLVPGMSFSTIHRGWISPNRFMISDGLGGFLIKDLSFTTLGSLEPTTGGPTTFGLLFKNVPADSVTASIDLTSYTGDRRFNVWNPSTYEWLGTATESPTGVPMGIDVGAEGVSGFYALFQSRNYWWAFPTSGTSNRVTRWELIVA